MKRACKTCLCGKSITANYLRLRYLTIRCESREQFAVCITRRYPSNMHPLATRISTKVEQ